MEFGVIMARQNFVFPGPSSCFCSLCQGKKGGGRHERGAAKRERGGGFSFVVLLFLYLSFEQGRARRRHVEVKMLYKGGDWVKGGGGLRRATA